MQPLPVRLLSIPSCGYRERKSQPRRFFSRIVENQALEEPVAQPKDEGSSGRSCARLTARTREALFTMPLTHDQADKLVKKIEKFQGNAINWNSVAGMDRRIVYIPFTKVQDTAEDGKQTMRETKEEERKALMLRSFAKVMQDIMDKEDPQQAADQMKAALGKSGKLDAGNLIDVFNAIGDANLKTAILAKTAAKTPIIIQRGEPLPKDFIINENDSIEIAGHGQNDDHFIQNAGLEMNAKQVLDGMLDDFGDQMQNIRKIKLTSCGSGGAFLDSFIAEAADEKCKLPGNIQVDGYNNQAFMIPKIEHALDHLDKGNRFVTSVEDLKALRDLKGKRSGIDGIIKEIHDEKVQWSLKNDPENIEGEGNGLTNKAVDAYEMEKKMKAFYAKLDQYDDQIQGYKNLRECVNQDIENLTFNPQKFKKASEDGSRTRKIITTVRDAMTSSSSPSTSVSPLGHKTGGSSSSNAPPSSPRKKMS